MRVPLILSILVLAVIASIVLQNMPVPSSISMEKDPRINSGNFGINFAWMNNHDGSESTAWMGDQYNDRRIQDDLNGITNLGINKIRVFIPIDSVMTYNGTGFVWSEPERTNLKDFMDACLVRNLSVVVVMSAGNHDGNYKTLDGKFRWPLLKSQPSINAYLEAEKEYIEFTDGHIISMYEFMNEPYGELTWSPGAKASGVTKDEVHNFLKQSYDAAKKWTNTPIGFSDLEEEEQYEKDGKPKYQVFSDVSNREKYIDDCTDIYSMHIYRPDSSYMANFTSMNSKPKWLTEVGGLNYYDPEAKIWPMPGHNELYSVTEDFKAVKTITDKALDQGFQSVYVWSWSSNIAMVKHNRDGSHTPTDLALWIKYQLGGN